MARGHPHTDDELLLTVQAYHEHGNNQVAAAKALGIKQNSFSYRIKEARARGIIFTPGGALHAMGSEPMPLPPKGKVARYLLTCAQDHTKVNDAFWNNLHAMAQHYDAYL